MYFCEISVPLKSKEVDIVYNAVVPEFSSIQDDRAKSKITKNENKLELSIEAQDITSLRSAVNSHLRYIKLSLDTLEAN